MDKKIAVILGSKSDLEELKAGFDILKEFSIGYRLEVVSAHRNPEKVRKLCHELQKQGTEVVIACAGLAAALPGFVASYVNIPVIGVALKGGLLDGLDALMSIVSTPRGLGLVSSGVGKSAFINSIIFALTIIALKDKKYLVKLKAVKEKFK
ncbi:MAG: AIR carboxylase family protein [Candidatus Omnitrophica bacterium]|jgi:5-(carboxyamino)imidazole ribonucleotide mutase|nr:AIR carboxylase family protein [Candidatus Omnitrophota bacterium]